MDVAYTCPQITLINSFYENGTYPLYCFKLLKRGQNEPGASIISFLILATS